MLKVAERLDEADLLESSKAAEATYKAGLTISTTSAAVSYHQNKTATVK